MKKRAPLRGRAAFEQYYQTLYGDRWEGLRDALCEPSRQIGWNENLREPYYMDSDSIAAARVLPSGGRNILDMCAAPGGKTLVLASSLEQGAAITANEFSRDRRARLLSVLDRYLASETRLQVQVTGHDASRWSRHETASHDRILLDVPCSSERHVLGSPPYLAQWSPARIRNLGFRQWALLSGAWLVLAPGGYLVYATCALSPVENDGAIRKLLRKYADAEILIPSEDTHPLLSHHQAERIEFGTIIMPDRSGGAGPLFFALVKKNDPDVPDQELSNPMFSPL